MGIITKLTLEEINYLIKDTHIVFEHLRETLNGITDSTYIGYDKENKAYIFKVFESSSLEEVKSEIAILNQLSSLKVPHLLSSKVEFYNHKPTALFSFIEGKISKEITLWQVKEIAHFLTQLHGSKIYETTNKNIYTKSYFNSMLKKIVDNDKINPEVKNRFIERYELIKEITLENNVLIHGDLFPDNAKFMDNKLSGVYDFGQSCFGNAYFDLSVLIISWCFNGYDFSEEYCNEIIKIYNQELNQTITKNSLKEYLLYACLYYSVQRFNRKTTLKDYTEYLKKFDILQKMN